MPTSSTSITDKLFMQRCLDLARMAEGFTSPNPMVGAVLVHQGRIIGEGYHREAGQPHAEVNCFTSVLPQDEPLVAQSTLYVSLEPCSHYGKTPPCVELIIKKKVPRVVVAMEDPFPQVAGRGLRRLIETGVEVVVGVLEKEANELNRHFLSAVRKQRPFITLKWAQSSDGFIDTLRNSNAECPFIFSTPMRQREVHRLRAIHDAILVGRKTVEMDNPSLTNRHWYGKNPIRIIIDPQLRLHRNYTLFEDNQSTTWVITHCPNLPEISLSHLEYIYLPEGEDFLNRLLHLLNNRGIQSLLVEGGSHTLQSFIDQGLFDAVEREISPIPLTQGIPAPSLDHR